MSFPSSFGTKVAAIINVLAKAAVAEITKLVHDEAVVFRLEMCRKDIEIHELQRSLQLVEAELCKVKEAAGDVATTRASGDKQEQADFGTQVYHKADQEGQDTVYMESKTFILLSEPAHQTEESTDLSSMVKSEPADSGATHETPDDNTRTTNNNENFKMEERDNPLWLPGMFKESSVEPAPATPQPLQIFSSHTEQFSARNNTESSYTSSSAAAEKIADDAFSAPIKEEVDMRPVCMGSTKSESLHNEQFRHVTHPRVSEDQSLQSTLQQAGPSLIPPHVQRSAEGTLGSGTPHAQDHILNRNNLRVKRSRNMWKINQKLFICPMCNKGFPRISQLEEHKSTHWGPKPFICLKCGKSFTQKMRLKSHQSVHTGERPYSCKICGKMFSRQDNCQRHERLHSGLKPYSCEHCGKSFACLSKMKIHQRIHLRGR